MIAALLGASSFTIAFSVSILTIFICFKVVIKITRYDDVNLILSNNHAASIVIVSAFIATSILVRQSLYPISAVLQDYFFLSQKSPMEFTIFVLRALGYLAISIVLSLFSVITALFIFQKLTVEFDENLEIQKNNGAVGILLSGVLIAFALMVESGISDFVNALIPIRDLLK